MLILIWLLSKNYKHYVQVDNNGKIKTFDKPVSQNDLNDAIAKTIIYYYNELKKEQL
jgi:hypothetical protein